MAVAGTVLTMTCVAGFLSVFIWPARALHGPTGVDPPPGSAFRGARWCAGGAGVLYLVVIAGISTPGVGGLFLAVLLFLARIAIIATVGAVAYTGLVWWHRLWSPIHRLHYTVVTALLVVFTVWFAFLDLAGWYL